jgi:hypothetical protein
VRPAFFPKFRKVIALVGSDREHERHNAADQAFRMCDENELTVLEAVDGCGKDDGELRKANELIDQMREDNHVLSDQVREFAEQMKEREMMPDDIDKQILEKVWSYRQVRVGAAVLLMMLRYFAAARYISLTNATGWYEKSIAWAMVLSGGISATMCTWMWVEAEFWKSGIGVASVKSFLFLTGIYLSIATFNGSMLVSEWNNSAECNGLAAEILFAFTGLIAISNFGNWLANVLAKSQREPFRALRSWFV